MIAAFRCLLLLGPLAAPLRGEPVVSNPGFETDRYSIWPGYASGNGGKITGWTFTGQVGLNPVRTKDKDHARREAFSDNGVIPHGRQVAFIQNVGTLAQTVAGFEAGKRYRVTYYENARHNRAPERNPRLEVLLGRQVIVSEHKVKPVEGIGMHTLPFDYVESAPFTAPRTGSFELKFVTTFGDRVAVLLDQVRIEELPPRNRPGKSRTK